MASAGPPSPLPRSARATAVAVLPDAVGPKRATTGRTGLGRDGDGRGAAERHRRDVLDAHRAERAGLGGPREDRVLVLARLAAHAAGIGAGCALDEHLDLAADQLAVAGVRVQLDPLDQPLEPLVLD